MTNSGSRSLATCAAKGSVAEFGDVFHLPRYVDLEASSDGARSEPLLLHGANPDRWVSPVTVSTRLIAGHMVRVALSPYGYSGPVCRTSSESYPQLVAPQIRDQLATHGVDLAFFRQHPILDRAAWPASEWARSIQTGETTAVDLSIGAEAATSAVRKSIRYDARRLRQAGFRVVLGGPELLPEFGSVYRSTMDRLDAASRYRFSDQYLSAIFESWSPHIHLVGVRSPAGDMAAAAMFSEFGGLVGYHLSGSVDSYRKIAPTKLLLVEALTIFAGRGAHWLHLGGGVGGAHDSLFDFKLGFGGHRFPFRTLRMIPDPVGLAQRLNLDLGVLTSWLDRTPFPPNP